MNRQLFAAMVREEFRLHSQLFGGRRFVAFPLVVLALSAGTVWLLATTGTDPGVIVAGLHALAFVFGLHTGSVGFVGRDAVQNLLGEVTLLVFSARTLPVSRQRLLGVFVLKDVCYYSALFLVPLALSAAAAGLRWALPWLWATTTLTFTLGVVVTIAAIGLSTRGVPGFVPPLALLGVVWLAVGTAVPVVRYTPYGLYSEPGVVSLVASVLGVAGLAAVGFLTLDPVGDRAARTATDEFGPLHARLASLPIGGLDEDGLVTKTLLDLRRSSGGVVKLPFSAGIVAGVGIATLELATRLTGLEPAAGIAMGAILPLSAFTTYNWLTQFDDPESYGAYPIAHARVFRAKAVAFVGLGLPTALGYYVLAVAWLGSAAAPAAVGAVLVVAVGTFLFGLTVGLAGLEPDEFLFDTAMFLAFTVAVTVALVPLLIVGLVMAPLSGVQLAGLAGWGVLVGLAGVGAYRWGVDRWTERYRDA